MEYISFSGGGVSGTAYLGVLHELKHQDIKYWAGTSVGSITALFACLNIKAEELQDFILDVDHEEIMGTRVTSWKSVFYSWNLLKNYGMIDGSRVRQWLSSILETYGIEEDITFRGIKDLTDNDLMVNATCVETMDSVYFTRYSHRNMKIVDAILASVSFPFVFQPCCHDNLTYIDGALKENNPIGAFDIRDSEDVTWGINTRAAGFSLKCFSHQHWTLGNIFSYGNKLGNYVYEELQRVKTINDYRICDISTRDITTFNRDVPREILLEIVSDARDDTREFVDSFPSKQDLFEPSAHAKSMGVKQIPDDISLCVSHNTRKEKSFLSKWLNQSKKHWTIIH